MANNEDLWPDNLVAEIPRTPTNILREQAAALGRKTRNVVQAKVRTRTDQGGDFLLTFVLHAPSIEGYEYDLFTVAHREDLYPVYDDDKVMENEASFIEYLRSLFSSPRTIRIVRALVAQSRAESDDSDDDIPF